MRLEIDQVTVAYGDSVAVRDVSLTVPEGRVVALLGPNGAGKTTLLSTASGLLKPRSGTVRINGRDVTRLRPEQRVAEGLCHITEGRSIFPGLSVAENLQMFSRPGQSDDGIDRAFTAFPRLGERRSQIAGTMSGGEQQMLAISRAYVQQAPVVMLDEVSMGLTPIIVDEIFEALRDLADSGHSLLIVEQFVAKALALADVAYVLVRGRVAFAGEPLELARSDVFEQYLGSESADRPHATRESVAS